MRGETGFFMIKTIRILILILMAATPVFAQSSLERGVLDELNLARTKPSVYAGLLKEYRGLYRGKSILFSGSNVSIHTAEGVSAVDEAVRFLAGQKPMSSLGSSRGLAEAAADLADEQGNSGATGHNGRESGSMIQRIERHGQWQVEIGEDISYGYEDPRLVVMQLIIDDGVGGRGHRKNIFNPVFRVAGVACGPHAGYGAMCVIDFAGGFSR
jgi:uncharacterized protein YkwD